jgi:hypothetical protein
MGRFSRKNIPANKEKAQPRKIEVALYISLILPVYQEKNVSNLLSQPQTHVC